MNASPLELLERAVNEAQKKAPSARNREIAEKVRVLGQRQVDVAAEYKLSQRRVSQICQQVAKWHSETRAWERGELDGVARRRAERVLRQEQLDQIVMRSMRAFGRSEQPLVTQRSGERPGGKWSEVSEREQRLDTSSLRVALRAVEQRGKLAEQREPEMDQDTEWVDWLKWNMASLAWFRREAVKRGDVPAGEDPQVLVERLVRELLTGTKPGPGEVPVDAAPAEPQTPLGKPAEAPEEALAEAPSNSNNRRGVEGYVEACVEELAAPPASAASAEPAARCDEPASAAGAVEGGEKFGGRRAPTESRDAVARDGVGSLWPQETPADGTALPAKDGGPLGAATRLERLLASRRLSPAMRRRLTERIERQGTG